MTYCDLNIHCPTPSSCVLMLEEELSLQGEILVGRVHSAIYEAGSQLARANIMLFNQNLSLEDIRKISKSAENNKSELVLTLLASPKIIRSFSRLECYMKSGIAAIKFHSYQQKISSDCFDSYVLLAKWAEQLRMPILVDASFGSLGMYTFRNLELVAAIASEIKNVPIVILHSGGARAIEALLLAEAASNIFLETSFSVPYYRNSTIEQDLAFAYKKIGANRVVYASDFPYISHQESIHAALEFFETNSFDSEEQEWIFKNTFNCIFPSKV